MMSGFSQVSLFFATLYHSTGIQFFLLKKSAVKLNFQGVYNFTLTIFEEKGASDKVSFTVIGLQPIKTRAELDSSTV